MHFLGIDIGTTSICGVVYDFLRQTTTAVTINNASALDSDKPWEKIQDPGWIITSIKQIIKDVEAQYPHIKGIGITGQMHGIVYVDSSGDAVSPLYTWQDNRGNLFLDNNTTYAAFLSHHSGHNLSTGYGLVTHFYNLKNSIVPERAVKLCTIMDYAVMKLAERKTPLIDCTNAAGLGFFSLEENHFNLSSLHGIGVDTSILPETGESVAFAGYYNSTVPVYSAIGDNQAGFIGSVIDRKKSIHLTIGTSSQLSVYTNDFVKVEGLDTRPFPGGGYILVGAALSGGQSLAVLQTLFSDVIKLTGTHSLESAAFFEMINAIEYKKNDAAALAVTTLFNGSRSNPSARGTISNISATNFTATDLILGFMRGICEEVYDFYEAIPYELKKDKNILIGSGNAVKRNDLLCKVLEETFNCRIVKSQYAEDAAFGACIAAMVGGKYVSDFGAILKISTKNQL
jgi:sedoheptulokinase